MMLSKMLRRGRVTDEVASPPPAADQLQDLRSVRDVLDSAVSSLLGSDPASMNTSAVAAAFEHEGIKWAWQLSYLPTESWKQSGACLGLQTAVKAAMCKPGLSAPSNDAALFVVDDVELTPRFRTFLLLPAEDGTPAKSMRRPSAVFYSVLCTPVEQRQTMMLAVCELLALMNGLFLTVPVSFLRISPPDPSAPKGFFDVWPTIDDGMTALGFTGFAFCLTGAIVAAMTGVLVASTGLQPGNTFYEALFPVLCAIFGTFFCTMWFTILQVLWYCFTVSGSPWPLIACLVIPWRLLDMLDATYFRCQSIGAPLEVYHLPRWTKTMLKAMVGPLLKNADGQNVMDDEVLRPAAEARAAELRRRLGITAHAVGMR